MTKKQAPAKPSTRRRAKSTAFLRKDPDPNKPLPDPQEEMFCQYRVDLMSQHEAYLTAFQKELGDAAARKAGYRLSAKVRIVERIKVVKDDRRREMMEQAKKFEASREAVIANAALGWQMAYAKGDIAGMSKHNNDIANFAREAYWHNRSEIAVEGPLEQILREVEEDGAYKPRRNGEAASGDFDDPPEAS